MHESAHPTPLQPANTLRVDIVQFLHLPKRFSYLMFLENDGSARRSVSVSCLSWSLSVSTAHGPGNTQDVFFLFREVTEEYDIYSPGKRALDASCPRASLETQTGKNPPAMEGTRVQSLGREDPLEKGMATHSSILSWRSPWTEEPGGLQSTASQRIRHD